MLPISGFRIGENGQDRLRNLGFGIPGLQSLDRIAEACCGCQVGLLDVDLCGPSVPRMLQIEDKTVIQGEDGFVELNCIVHD